MTNPITKDRRHFEDLQVGEVIALGPQLVTKQMIIGFAKEFDPLPFHLEEEAAKQSLLGGLAASGWHTGALSLRMLVDNFLSKTAFAGGLNFKNLRWHRPLFVNDTLSGSVTITELRRLKTRPQWANVTQQFDMRNQKGETVMTMTLSNIVDVRDPSKPIKDEDESEAQTQSETSKTQAAK